MSNIIHIIDDNDSSNDCKFYDAKLVEDPFIICPLCTLQNPTTSTHCDACNYDFDNFNCNSIEVADSQCGKIIQSLVSDSNSISISISISISNSNSNSNSNPDDSICIGSKRSVDYINDKCEYFTGDCATYGIIPLLRMILSRDSHNSISKEVERSFKLCSDPFPHIKQCGFEGKEWSCGYRNIQMMCAGLMTQTIFRKVLFNGKGDVPDIPQIQRSIEDAWGAGFDTAGSEQLGHLFGTDKWIGACECATLLRQFGINAVIVDFRNSNSNNSNMNSNRSIAKRLENWLKRYYIAFEGTDFTPLIYFQHAGHSRSIIGYNIANQTAKSSKSTNNNLNNIKQTNSLENFGYSTSKKTNCFFNHYYPQLHPHELKKASVHRKQLAPLCDKCNQCCINNETDSVSYCCDVCDFDICSKCISNESPSNNLPSEIEDIDKSFDVLLFDPAHDGKVIFESLNNSKGNVGENKDSRWKSMLKRGLHTFMAKEYQLVYVRQRIINKGSLEYDESKILKSVSDADDILT